MKRFRDYDPDQLLILPPSLNEWLPTDHFAHFLGDVVDGLDLSDIYGVYKDERGNPPYAPVMMTKVWLYAYSVGLRSSRRLEKALYEDVALRFLSGNQQPDHWTLSDFRRRHHVALGNLFKQTVVMAQRAGMVRMGQLAVDGTKIKANASKHSAMSYDRMDKEEKRLQADIDRFFKEADEIDAEEDKKYGNSHGDELPQHLNTHQKRLEAIRAAKKAIEDEAREKAEAEQKERRQKAEEDDRDFKGRKDPKEAKPEPKAQRNFTDPESRIMKGSDGFVQAYNAQAGVDAHSQIIVAADLTNQSADTPHLSTIVDQAIDNTGITPEQVLADAGYYSDANVAAVEATGSEALIPPNRVKHSEWRGQTTPRGRIPVNLSRKDRMRRKLRTKKGRSDYKLRMTSVEPVFGQIKEGRGLRQFLHRGLDKVRSMWRFDCAAHNLLKMFRAGVRAMAGGQVQMVGG